VLPEKTIMGYSALRDNIHEFIGQHVGFAENEASPAAIAEIPGTTAACRIARPGPGFRSLVVAIHERPPHPSGSRDAKLNPETMILRDLGLHVRVPTC